MPAQNAVATVPIASTPGSLELELRSSGLNASSSYPTLRCLGFPGLGDRDELHSA